MISIDTLKKHWHEFWFVPESIIPTAITRIIFGGLLIQFGVLLAPELHTLLGEKSILPRIRDNAWWGTPAFSILDYLPHKDYSLDWLFALFMMCAIFLTFGVWTRISAFFIWMIMCSWYARNPYVFGASDSILRTVAFCLIFSHAGNALSLTRLLEVWTKRECPSYQVQCFKPWALRLIQIHFALVWWVGCTRKFQGVDWMNGTALYYVLHVKELVRYPLPLPADNLVASRVISWLTMLIEFSLAILIWIKELRIPLIFIGIIFHLVMDWALWVPQFEYVMIAGLITFIEPSTYSKLMNQLRKYIRILGLTPLKVAYNSTFDLSCRLAETIRRLDVFHLVELIEYNNPLNISLRPELPPTSGLVIFDKDNPITGLKAAQLLAQRLPLLMLIYPLFLLPVSAPMLKRIAHVLSQRF